jgi:hypothetical protein
MADTLFSNHTLFDLDVILFNIFSKFVYGDVIEL